MAKVPPRLEQPGKRVAWCREVCVCVCIGLPFRLVWLRIEGTGSDGFDFYLCVLRVCLSKVQLKLSDDS